MDAPTYTAEGGMSMGVYIKDMEMPTEEQSVITINIYSDGVVTCYDDDVERKATPVPPHGKLIDVADVKELFEKHFGDDQIAFQLIDSVPVIIPPKSKEQQDLEDLVERLKREGIAP